MKRAAVGNLTYVVGDVRNVCRQAFIEPTVAREKSGVLKNSELLGRKFLGKPKHYDTREPTQLAAAKSRNDQAIH